MIPTKVLVCGGREYDDRGMVFAALDALWFDSPPRRVVAVIDGGCRTGADAFAREWARYRGITPTTVHADWDRFGRAAGPVRNRAMLALDPDVVLAFPTPGAENRGTWDMVAIARGAEIDVRVFE